MRVLVLALVVAALVLAGCGNREGTISEQAVVESVHRAGFADVHRLTGPKAPSPSAFAGAGRDLFYVGPFRADGRFQLAVLWSSSAPPPLSIDRRQRSARVHQAQVCNADVSSYGEDARFERVVALLRKRCR